MRGGSGLCWIHNKYDRLEKSLKVINNMNSKIEINKQFCREHPSIKKIMVDLFFYENEFKVFDKEQLLNNAADLKLFNCRPTCKQRGK